MKLPDKPKLSIVKSPRHTVKDFHKALGAMMQKYEDIDEAVILEARVNTDESSIYDGAIVLGLYRPDLGETGELTMPVLKPHEPQ